MIPVILHSERVLLRSLSLRDAMQLREAVRSSLPELSPWMPWATKDYDMKEARRFIDFARECEEQARGCHRAICRLEGGDLVGMIGFNTIAHPPLSNAELGYWMKSSGAGQGLMTEAARLIVDAGFEHLELRRIHLTCDVDNQASRRIAEKLGMQREGLMKAYLTIDGEPRDHALYAVLSEEFEG